MSCLLEGFLILYALVAAVAAGNPTYYNIGGVLSNNESQAQFKEIIAVSLIKFNYRFLNRYDLNYLIYY